MKKDKEQTIPDVLIKFANLLGAEIKNRKLEIPKRFGRGYCIGFVFNEYIRMLISDYELNEDIVIENPEANAHVNRILFKFQNIFPQVGIFRAENRIKAIPSVLIATSRINTDAIIPIHTNTATINIEIDANYLNGLFNPSESSLVLRSLLQDAQPLLFEQIIYPSLQKIVDEIVTGSIDEIFELFFFRVKAEELVCNLLMKLEKRDEKHLYTLNNYDIQAIYKVKEQILGEIGTAPNIKELTILAGMSPTKLKRLFKQIFGNSIFSYYQDFRMKEAARLLKEEKLSVSETGYQLGFTNLSHFSRVFYEHIGMKPKQYTKL